MGKSYRANDYRDYNKRENRSFNGNRKHKAMMVNHASKQGSRLVKEDSKARFDRQEN